MVDLAEDLDPTDTLEALTCKAASTREEARDELHVGYVAVTRARHQLGALAIAEPLHAHGFPALTTSLVDPASDCRGQPAQLVAGDVHRTWVQIPLETTLWQALVDAYGHPDSAAAAAGLLLEHHLAASRPELPAPDTAAPITATATPTRSRSDYPSVADETLGTAAADTIRALLDQALESVVEATSGAGATRAGYTDEALMELLAEAITATGLHVHRARGVGYSLTTDITGAPVRLSGSNFGAGYSGPALVRTLRAG